MTNGAHPHRTRARAVDAKRHRQRSRLRICRRRPGRRRRLANAQQRDIGRRIAAGQSGVEPPAVGEPHLGLVEPPRQGLFGNDDKALAPQRAGKALAAANRDAGYQRAGRRSARRKRL